MHSLLRWVKKATLALPFGDRAYGVALGIYQDLLRLHARLLRAYAKRKARATGENRFVWQNFQVVESIDDIYYVSALQDGMSNHVKRVDAIAKVLGKHRDLVIFDVGANIGIYTLLFSRFPGSKVYAFEPVGRTYAYLKRNIEGNRVGNAIVEPVGLSNADGELFIAPPETARKSTVFSVLADPNAPLSRELGEMARFTTLDGYCRQAGIARIDFLKIDVEGHEPAVLDGGAETIARCRPAMQIEVAQDAHRIGPSQEVFARLEKWGYDVFGWTGETLVCLDSVEGWLKAEGIDLDIVALPRPEPT